MVGKANLARRCWSGRKKVRWIKERVFGVFESSVTHVMEEQSLVFCMVNLTITRGIHSKKKNVFLSCFVMRL